MKIIIRILSKKLLNDSCGYFGNDFVKLPVEIIPTHQLSKKLSLRQFTISMKIFGSQNLELLTHSNILLGIVNFSHAIRSLPKKFGCDSHKKYRNIHRNWS